ncbi:hemoglobin subunit beta-like [Hypanus sabinus]|uniref:hemoglobin subunit beta-like n=1 Tax=Hypanus sabinus TaxID=79690 RepID=UPI0028C467B5|nr:hemoglobin subunit beta-like [Hypanus sabinus]
MGKLTEPEAQYIQSTWGSLNKKAVTAQALARVFEVYPWTTRLFSKLGGKFSAGDDGVQAHADKVLQALDKAVQNINKMDNILGDLSETHQQIGVDTQNFKLLGQTFIVEFAREFKVGFTPAAHKATYKFFRQVANGLSCRYH